MDRKITFFLMSYKGYYVLKEILSAFDKIIVDMVISSRDLMVEEDYYDKIKDLTIFSGIKFYNRDDSFVIDTQYVIAISWRWLIQTQSKLIVLHDSLLPKYRGFSPLVTALINNENIVGVTAIFATEEYDAGEIIERREIKISYPIKIFDLFKVITPLYIEIVKSMINKIIMGISLNTIKQDEGDISYCLWLDEYDYYIDWSWSSNQIKRFIDAVGFPYLGAYTYIERKKVRILDAEVVNDVNIVNRSPGKVFVIKNGNPIIVCGGGLLMVTKIIDDSTGQNVLPLKRIKTRFE